jgi:tetratricopeptide (TPR) repeat protein
MRSMSAKEAGTRRNLLGGMAKRKWLVVLLSTLALGLAVALAARGQFTAYMAAREARQAVAVRRFELAVPALDRWLRSSPDSAEAHFVKSQVYFELARFDETSQALDRAQWLGYPERPLYRQRALLLVRLRRYVEAEPILLHLLDESQEPDPEADEALTLVFLETYRLELAVKVIERWVRDAPRDPRPYLWWTEVDFRLEVDNAEGMERHFRTALELDPKLDRARIGLADLLCRLHRDAEARTEYEAYVARCPDDVRGHIGLAKIDLKDGDIASAVRRVELTLAIDPTNVEVLKMRAAIDSRHGDHAAALRYLNRAIEAAPTDLDSLYARLLALGRLGRKEEVEVERKRVDRLRKDHVDVVRIRDRLIANPNNNDIRFEMAQWMLEHGRSEETKRWIQTILAQQPKHVPSLQLLAKYHEGAGEIGLANYYRSLAETVR